MALKRIERKIIPKAANAAAGGLKKLDMGALKRRRDAAKALDFVPAVRDDILGDIPDDAKPEAIEAARIAALDGALICEKPKTDSSTIKADLKRQGEAHKNQAATDYYCCVVFADGEALSEFLKKTGYPEPDATFIDGYLLADALGMKDLPRPKFQLQKIRPPQKSLSRLVTAFPNKGAQA